MEHRVLALIQLYRFIAVVSIEKVEHAAKEQSYRVSTLPCPAANGLVRITAAQRIHELVDGDQDVPEVPR